MTRLSHYSLNEVSPSRANVTLGCRRCDIKDVMDPPYDHPLFQAVVDQFGEPESRRLLSTPALVCEHDLLVENVARMATKTALAGTALRPHLKSHKSAYVARLQLEAGASGLAFAKLSEAEAVTARLRSDGYRLEE